MTTTRDQIVEQARRYLGTRWRHMGRSEIGLDCVGLAVRVANDLGLETPREVSYARHPDGTLLPRFREHLEEIQLAEAQDGDLVVFSQVSHPCHCGLLSTRHGARHVIHAHAGRRKVLEEPLDQARSIVGIPTHAFRLPGVEV